MFLRAVPGGSGMKLESCNFYLFLEIWEVNNYHFCNTRPWRALRKRRQRSTSYKFFVPWSFFFIKFILSQTQFAKEFIWGRQTSEVESSVVQGQKIEICQRWFHWQKWLYWQKWLHHWQKFCNTGFSTNKKSRSLWASSLREPKDN